jgi:hypothetical protein
MNLSDSEKRMVAKLRKREASLVRWRWGIAIVALGYVGLGAFGLAVALRFLQTEDPNTPLVLSFLVPLIFLVTLIGVGLGVYLSLRWQGRPETVLLLRLI